MKNEEVRKLLNSFYSVEIVYGNCFADCNSGSLLPSSADDAISLSELIGKPVIFKFNHIRVKVTKDSTVKEAMEYYDQELLSRPKIEF